MGVSTPWQVYRVPFENVLELRHEVLLPHLASPAECELPGDREEEAIHLAAVVGDLTIGVASFLPEHFPQERPDLTDLPAMRLRQMGVQGSFRYLGAARSLFKTGLELVSSKGKTLVWCHAREVSFGFYEKMGMSYGGGFFEVPSVGRHRIMFIQL